MNKPQSKVSIVVPVFNEALNVQILLNELLLILAEMPYQSEIIFIDDGSTDDSLSLIKKMAEEHPNVFYIELSRNFGHQYALKAGLDIADGDCVISMDSDMQHPPGIVRELIKKWEEGFDVVYTTRNDDKNVPWLKRKTSKYFYKILNVLSDLKLDHGTADFRLMSRNMLNAFVDLNESELFIRGLVKWAGFRQTSICYDPSDRYAGESKYDLRKMLAFGLRGITSFSVRPLRMSAYLGMILFLFSIFLVPYALISYFIGSAVSGWTSVMITIFFFGSLQLLMIGVIGLYISKLVIQSKQRPLYFIRETNYRSIKK